jgi:O-antigen/teichoic acid export membrane protein
VDHQTRSSDNFNLRAFCSDVLIYSFGQAILLIFGFVQSLIIPKYLSTADYGYWQLFLLCTTYVGILHLGFLNGILIKWAGRNLEDFKEEVPLAFKFTLIEQGIIIGILVLIVWLIDLPSKEMALMVLANALIVNLLMFFVITAQATKRFKLITVANISKGLLFLIFILAVFFSGYHGYFPLILATITAGLIILLLFAFHLRDNLFYHGGHRISLFQYGKDNIRIGIFVLLGNFIALLFTTIDRLTVGSFFPITQFAVYAFAMTMCGLAVVFLQAVAQVFFPYLSGSGSETRTKAYHLLRPVLVIFWAGVLAAYFPLSDVIRSYLPHYADSLPLMAILLCTVGFSGQIQILHANFFNVYLKQRTYFTLAGISFVGAVALNLLAIMIFGTLTAVAVTAVVSFSIWYLLNEFALRRFVATDTWEVARWLLVIGVYAGAFLVTSMLALEWVYGMVIYLAIFVLVTGTGLKSEIISLLNLVSAVVNRNKDTKVVQIGK